jgi:hypothetical protein
MGGPGSGRKATGRAAKPAGKKSIPDKERTHVPKYFGFGIGFRMVKRK